MTRKQQRDFIRVMLGDPGGERYGDTYLNQVLDISDIFQCTIAQFLVKVNFDVTKIDTQGYIINFMDSIKKYHDMKAQRESGIIKSTVN